jgi:ribosomal protein L24E
MPKSAHPNRRDHYVYAFTADGCAFYVGIGRADRAPDRIRWVKSQRKRESKGLKAKWARHTSVIAKCLDLKMAVKPWYLQRGMTRKEALNRERQSIARYLSRGFELANCQHNPAYRQSSVAKILAHIRRHAKAA